MATRKTTKNELILIIRELKSMLEKSRTLNKTYEDILKKIFETIATEDKKDKKALIIITVFWLIYILFLLCGMWLI